MIWPHDLSPKRAVIEDGIWQDESCASALGAYQSGSRLRKPLHDGSVELRRVRPYSRGFRAICIRSHTEGPLPKPVAAHQHHGVRNSSKNMAKELRMARAALLRVDAVMDKLSFVLAVRARENVSAPESEMSRPLLLKLHRWITLVFALPLLAIVLTGLAAGPSIGGIIDCYRQRGATPRKRRICLGVVSGG